MNFEWMAWTTPTAIFFATIGLLIAAMLIWELISPGGGPRNGILGLDTTRGDRLFLSLLLSAFVSLAWLAWTSWPLWWALGLCLIVAVLIFRFF